MLKCHTLFGKAGVKTPFYLSKYRIFDKPGGLVSFKSWRFPKARLPAPCHLAHLAKYRIFDKIQIIIATETSLFSGLLTIASIVSWHTGLTFGQANRTMSFCAKNTKIRDTSTVHLDSSVSVSRERNLVIGLYYNETNERRFSL